MLKVSLLPESYRKKVSGSKKKESLKRLFLDILVMLLGFLVVILFTRAVVEGKLDEVKQQNEAVIAQFPQLQSYQTLYNDLLAQKQLIEMVSAKAPYAQDFIVSLGNIESNGLWLTAINADDWFYTKTCTLEGKCFSNTSLIKYMEALRKLDGVISVTRTAFEITDKTTGTGDVVFGFTLTVTVSGTGTKYVAPTVVATAATTAVNATGG